jgi:hypothetical protein
MAKADGIADLGPLPESDDNAELQRSSIKALNSLLQGQDTILFRDERIEDYGVDGSFELNIQGHVTNFRANVQLKGTASVEVNQDGSVSLSVHTANLNYLLNGTSPLYLLFDAQKNEFWYAWAQDESRRLEAANPAWKQQGQVTLRFNKRLDTRALGIIVDGVLRNGRMLRQIHDSLARATTNEPIVVRIDSATLETTDPSQAKIILMASGTAIVAAGYPKQVLHLLQLVDSTTRSLPRLQLTAGYAEYMLGNHYNALGHIRQAMARTQNLSDRDRTFLNRLKDACEFRVGIIDTATYGLRTHERGQNLRGLEAFEAQLEAVYYRFLRERDPDLQAKLSGEAREIANRILNHSEATEPIKLGARLTLLYVEGTEANLAATHQKGLSWMRASMSILPTKGMLQGYQQATSRMANWEVASNAALKSAFEIGHPILIAEAYRVMLGVFAVHLSNQRLEALCLDKAFEVPKLIVSKMLRGIASALEIDEVNGNVEGRLRLNMLNADLLEIVGDLASAKELAARIYPEAEAMGFANIAERAKELLEERTLLTQIERDMTRLKQTDEDVSFTNLGDDELARFARDALESMGLPEGRRKIVEEYCHSLRKVAQERWHWCRHLEMYDDLRQTRDPATAFSVLPNRRCVCKKFAYETQIETSNVHALISAFKQLYCASCKDRSPKQAESG